MDKSSKSISQASKTKCVSEMRHRQRWKRAGHLSIKQRPISPVIGTSARRRGNEIEREIHFVNAARGVREWRPSLPDEWAGGWRW